MVEKEKVKEESKNVFVDDKKSFEAINTDTEKDILDTTANKTQKNTVDKQQAIQEYNLDSKWVHNLQTCVYFDDDSINISHTRSLLSDTKEVNSFISYLQTENTKADTKKYSAEEICTNIGIIGSILSNQDVIDKNIDRDMLKKTCIEFNRMCRQS